MNNKYEIKILTSKEAEDFKSMTYGQYKPFLAWIDNVLGQLFPLALFYEGKPAGLLLGLKLDANDYLDILSLFIEKPHRGQKLSVEMINFLEELCREFDIKNIEVFYFDNRPFAPIINKIFDKCGYGPVEPSVFFCKCDKNFVNMPAIEYTDLPAGFETFKWSDLSRHYKEKLKNEWKNEKWFDEMLSPFKSEDTMVPEISLGLKKDGRIVGWTICDLIENEKTILYTSIFIMPEFQGAALGIALQMRSIRGHLLTGLAEKYPYALFEVKYENRVRLKMVKKKFAKYAVEQYNQVTRKKCLL